jgi:hypothetical protein
MADGGHLRTGMRPPAAWGWISPGIQHRAGEDLIGPVRQARQPCHRTRLLAQGAVDRVTYRAGGGTGQATMTGDGYAPHPILLTTA